jgi:protein-export membrane protein SecD
MKASRRTATILTATLLFVSVTTACSLWRRKPALTRHLVLQIDAPTTEREALVKKALVVIQKRLDAVGLRNFEVKPEGPPEDGRVLVRLPAASDADRLKDLITAAGKLEFVHVISPPSPNMLQTYATRDEALASITFNGTRPKQFRVLPFNQRDNPIASQSEKWLVVGSTPIITGDDLRTATAYPSRVGDSYDISFSLNKVGAEKFEAWTTANIHEYLGVVLNDEVKSTAFIKSTISDEGQINGNFTKQMAEDLALVLKSGTLPARLTIVEETIDR